MKDLWDLIKYLSGSHPENKEKEKDLGQQETYGERSYPSKGFDRNQPYGNSDWDYRDEPDWSPEAEIGDEREGWGWDCWKLWW